jgi:DNA modification methylase
MIEEYLNKIICGDSLTIMRQMPDRCIDLVVTSPPYNLKNSTGNGMKDGRGGKWAGAALVNGYNHYDDNMPHEEYEEWQHKNLKEMYRLIKDDGAIFYNHKWRVRTVYYKTCKILFVTCLSGKSLFGDAKEVLTLFQDIFYLRMRLFI